MKLALTSLFFVFSCAHVPENLSQSFWQNADNISRSIKYADSVLKEKGSFDFQVELGKRIHLNTLGESVIADFYNSNVNSPSPLVIFSHGNKSYKEAHKTQAERFASWGFQVVNVQFPNRKRWVKNGKILASIVESLHVHKKKSDFKFDSNKIFVVGHSFGGSSAIIAASMQDKIKGLILLDPAVVHSTVLEKMPEVKIPVFLLGADQSRYKAKKRKQFYKRIGGNFLELSVLGATHNDAQYPSMTQIFAFGMDPLVSSKFQENFLELSLVAALDLSLGKQMGFARQFYGFARKNKNMVKNIKWRNQNSKVKGRF